MKFLLTSVKTETNLSDCSESRIKFTFRLSFALNGRFSPVNIHDRGFWNNFQDHNRLLALVSQVVI